MSGFTQLLLALVIVLLVVLVMVAFRRTQTSNIYRDNIYLDNNGTTKPHREVVDAIQRASYYGNASATYSNAAKIEMQQLREKAAAWADAPVDKYHVVITSGASEANNLILRSVVELYASKEIKPHIILSAVEHKTSLECVDRMSEVGAIEFTIVEPTKEGLIRPEDVQAAIKPNTALISIMSGNNETGALMNIAGIAQVASQNNVAFHTDAVQTFGKHRPRMNELGVDALSMSFHKMHGPMGIGLLIIKKTLDIEAQIAGTQNYHMRGGTENIPAIAGAVKALDITLKDREAKNAELQAKKDYIINYLSSKMMVLDFDAYRGLDDETAESVARDGIQYDALSGGKSGARGVDDNPKGIVFLGPVDKKIPDNRSNPNTILLSIISLSDIMGKQHPYNRFCNIKLRSDLAAQNVVLSIGSACNTGEKGASHVLHALDAPFVVRCGVVRISLSDYTTMREVRAFCHKFHDALKLQ